MKYVLAFLLILVAPSLIAQELDVEEVTIVGEYIPDEKLETSEVSDILDAEDISIAGDSNIGDALKRLPGVSLVGGKYAYIRGLGDRYSSTYFNGTPIPGIEPLKRAVPLDLFDSSVTSSVLVQKTYSPNYGAGFSGGVVDIRSANVPDENFFKLKIKTAYNSETTGKQGLTYDGGNKDWTGYDDGRRELPGAIEAEFDKYPTIQRFYTAQPDPLPLFGISDADLPLINAASAIPASLYRTDWTPQTKTFDPNYGVSFAAGGEFELFEGVYLGGLATGTYDNSVKTRYRKKAQWNIPTKVIPNIQSGSATGIVPSSFADILPETISPSMAVDTLINSTRENDSDNFSSDNGLDVEGVTQTINQIDVTGLGILGINFYDMSKITLTRMLLRQTSDMAQVTRSKAEVGGQFNDRFEHFIEWAENEIAVSQISGEHFFGDAAVNWRYADISGDRITPDVTNYITDFNSPSLPVAAEKDIAFADINSTVNPTRTWTFLENSGRDKGIDVEFPFYFDFDYFQELTIKAGYSEYRSSRDYSSARFAYQFALGGSDGVDGLAIEDVLDPAGCTWSLDTVPSPLVEDLTDNCYLRDAPALIAERDLLEIGFGIEVTEGFGQPDAFTGKESIDAFYLGFDIKFNEIFRLNLGARDEKFDMRVVTTTPIIGATVREGFRELVSELGSDDLYPAASFTWSFVENMQLRAAYSQTENRPIFRELTPVEVYIASEDEIYSGNRTLQITSIENFDLRYEWYFGDADYLSISWFKKNIDKPVEVVSSQPGSEAAYLTWVNRDDAVNKGIEVELRKYFDDYWLVIFNTTQLSSNVVSDGGRLPPEINGATGEEIGEGEEVDPVDGRPLQGLSEELYNFQFIYEGEVSTFALSLNGFSKRIHEIDYTLREDIIYENPFWSLNANWKYSFGPEDDRFTLGFKVTNLLDEKVERVYEFRDLPSETYDVGQTYSLSLQWKHSSW